MKTTTKSLLQLHGQDTESSDHAARGIAAALAMFRVVPSYSRIGAALVLFYFSPLHAGNVSLISGAPGASGTLTLDASSVHVEGGSPADFKLTDLLEADFNDGDFHLDYFCSDETSDQLPANWQGHDIGHVDVPGSNTFSHGVLTISGNGRVINSAKDRYYYLSRPWSGNGEWTMHIQKFGTDTADAPTPIAGLMLRDNFDPGAAMFGFGTAPVRVDGGQNGSQYHRNNAGEGAQWNAINVNEPFWLRVSRNSSNFDISLSTDGQKWDLVEHDVVPTFPRSFQAGIFITSNVEDLVGKAVVDHILATPVPAEPETLPPGVILRDGTFLAGAFNNLGPTGGNFNLMDKNVTIGPDAIASVIFIPATRERLAAVETKVGVLMKNGDFFASDLQSIQGGGWQMSSISLGVLNNNSGQAAAIVLHAVKPLPSDYEVRLKDGSIIRTDGISLEKGQIAITDVSGIVLNVDPSEVAQFRAGTTRVQTLIDLAWKATPATIPNPLVVAPEEKAAPVSAPPAPVTNEVVNADPPAATNAPDATPATNAVGADGAPADPPAPAIAPATNGVPTVRCWQGGNEEEIMMVLPGTTIDFPLAGKFRAMAVKVALSPDAAPEAQAIVRVLADGKDVGSAGPLKAGDAPRFVQVRLQNPRTVTLVADSASPGAKILYIDPVVVRQ